MVGTKSCLLRTIYSEALRGTSSAGTASEERGEPLSTLPRGGSGGGTQDGTTNQNVLFTLIPEYKSTAQTLNHTYANRRRYYDLLFYTLALC